MTPLPEGVKLALAWIGGPRFAERVCRSSKKENEESEEEEREEEVDYE